MKYSKSLVAPLLERLRLERMVPPDDTGTAPDTMTAATPATYRKLLDLFNLSPALFADIVAEVHGLPRARLDDLLAGTSLVDRFSPVFLAEAGMYPYVAGNGALRLATADPSAGDILHAIALSLDGEVTVEVVSFEDIEIALSRANAAASEETVVASNDRAGEADDEDGLRDLASGAPVVKALDDIFERAVAMRATDIHIEPTRGHFQIRVRIDGVLQSLPAPAGIAARALVSRIKIVSGLNIAERRLPQDGRTRIKVRAREFDVRVATMPTTNGEAAILRLLDRGGRLTEFDQLGFSTRDTDVMRRQLAMPFGLIVVTGRPAAARRRHSPRRCRS